MFETIIWATDGSEAAELALSTALELTAEADGDFSWCMPTSASAVAPGCAYVRG